MMSPPPQVQIQRVFDTSQRQDGSSSLCPGIGQWIWNGSSLRRPGYAEPAQKLDFPAPQAGLRLINRKSGLSVAQGNRGLIGVLDNAGKLPVHRITDLLSMTPGLCLKARGFYFSLFCLLSTPPLRGMRRSTRRGLSRAWQNRFRHQLPA